MELQGRSSRLDYNKYALEYSLFVCRKLMKETKYESTTNILSLGYYHW